MSETSRIIERMAKSYREKLKRAAIRESQKRQSRRLVALGNRYNPKKGTQASALRISPAAETRACGSATVPGGAGRRGRPAESGVSRHSEAPRAAFSRAARAFLFLALAGLPLRAQTYPDLGRALYARGYTGTVWVNGFDSSQSYLAHGVFYPGSTTDFDVRYGMAVTGSGTVSVDANGFYTATGTAINPNPISSDGSIAIDLLSNGNRADGVKVPFACGPSATCSWTARFQTKAPLPNPSVRVYRHVEGSVCGGELTIDLNTDCRSALISYFQLPSTYTFTTTDQVDTNYVSKPGATTSALCAVIFPICGNLSAPSGGGGTPAPPATGCESGQCSATCTVLCPGGVWPVVTVTPPTPICPVGTVCRAECPAAPPEKICPPEKVCSDPVPCPACPAAVVCPAAAVCPAPIVCPECLPAPVHPPNTACAEHLSTLKALAAGQPVKNAAKVRRAAACVLAHPGVTP